MRKANPDVKYEKIIKRYYSRNRNVITTELFQEKIAQLPKRIYSNMLISPSLLGRFIKKQKQKQEKEKKKTVVLTLKIILSQCFTNFSLTTNRAAQIVQKTQKYLLPPAEKQFKGMVF